MRENEFELPARVTLEIPEANRSRTIPEDKNLLTLDQALKLLMKAGRWSKADGFRHNAGDYSITVVAAASSYPYRLHFDGSGHEQLAYFNDADADGPAGHIWRTLEAAYKAQQQSQKDARIEESRKREVEGRERAIRVAEQIKRKYEL